MVDSNGTGGNGDGEHPHRQLLLQRIEHLRKKLLDLGNRNRLISFKHSDRARTHVRVIDELPGVLFSRLTEGKRMRFKSLPEPETEPLDESSDEFLMELEASRATDEVYVTAMRSLDEADTSSKDAARIERSLHDRVRETLGMEPWVDQSALSKEDFARLHGLEPAYDLPKPFGYGGDGDGNEPERWTDDDIQTLLYPRELDRKLTGIVDQSKTMMNEAGVATLRVAFGFLEWMEPPPSDKKHLSPLVLFPATIKGQAARPWRRFDLTGGGSDIETNKTLSMRLNHDFGFDLPKFGEEDTPESYLAEVERSVESNPNWRVRRFVTVGNFGYSKLAMHTDLSADHWPSTKGLPGNKLIQKVLLGDGEADGESFDAPDYDIDSPATDAKDIFLVTDADASQFSAVIDAVEGKNIVVSGPPGTGKSQTITNIISASLALGKRVLFVAEKMAALNVVSSRLRAAGLADFCLEVHSNKSSKAGVLKSLKQRVEVQNATLSPAEFQSKLAQLRNVRDKMNDYVQTLNQPIGELKKTVNEIFWGELRARDDAGETWEIVRNIGLVGIVALTQSQWMAQRNAITDVLARISDLAAVSGNLKDHPWAWVTNTKLTPIDQEEAQVATSSWGESLGDLALRADEIEEKIGPIEQPSRSKLARVVNNVGRLTNPSHPLVVGLAKAMIDDSTRQLSSELVVLATVEPSASHMEKVPVLSIPKNFRRLANLVREPNQSDFDNRRLSPGRE